MNPDISKKYFAVEQNSTAGNQELFTKKKAGTFRIFVLGASSSIGFPYMHNGAFPRLLKYRLQLSYPDLEFEIINLSLTAVNSFTLYDFSKQVVCKEPDAVLIYAGHNEYYGALGVASTSSIGSNPGWIRAMLEAKKFKFVQGLFKLAARLKKTDKHITDYNLTLMERMAAEQSIPYQSPLFCGGIRQFRRNMEDMLNLFHSHQIPAFVSTLVSNQRSLKPFISDPDCPDSLNATFLYEKGNKAYAAKDYETAKDCYTLAKEYDELRFRAPEKMNGIIREQAGKRESIYLVDALEAFQAHSPYGILDSTLLLEHVHPNLTGQKLLAETFYKEILNSGLLPPVSHPVVPHFTSEDYPLTAYDHIFGDISILLLKELWPFNEVLPKEDSSHVKTFEEQLAGATAVRQISWYEAMPSLYKYYEQNNRIPDALRVMEGLCLEFPLNEGYLLQAGKLCLRQDIDRKAWYYFMRSDRVRPSSEKASNIAIALLKMDMPDEAMPYIERVIRDKNSSVDFVPLKQIVEYIIALKQQLSVRPSDPSIRRAIATYYERMGNGKAASVYLE
jgi:tetratricopeptide (TPR) repeat protein